MNNSKKSKIINYRGIPKDVKGKFIKGIHYSPETEFKQGQPPNNFGRGVFKKGHPGYNKKSNLGSFKKGQPNPNKGKGGLWGVNKGSFQKGNISWMKGRFGEKASNWKEGRTAIAEAIRKSENFKKWRMTVYSKDNFTCQFCKSRGRGVKLEAHHLKSLVKILEENNIKTVERAIKCKELWDINNGIILCSSCHNLTKYGRRKI